MHLFKKQDEQHAEWTDHTETTREVFEREAELTLTISEEHDTESDGRETGDDRPDLDGPDPSDAVDDDGPITPPEPSVSGHDDDESPPDHLQPVEEFIEELEEEVPDRLQQREEWSEFVEDIRDGEPFVDVRASDIETGEVTTTHV